MATRQSTVDYIIDQLSSLRGVRAARMFGEYALYCGEKVVALVCDDQLFVKKTEAGTELINGRFEDAPPYPGARPSMLVSVDVLEDRELLSSLIARTAGALPVPKPKLYGKANKNREVKIKKQEKEMLCKGTGKIR